MFTLQDGESVLRLLSKAGAVKTMTLQLAVRDTNQQPIDVDDLNYVRVLTQICEIDSKRFEDVILIGGTKRIIAILRKHLVSQDTLLQDEIEMQRRCMRFLERVLTKPPVLHVYICMHIDDASWFGARVSESSDRM